MKPILRTHQSLSPLETLGCITYILMIALAYLLAFLAATATITGLLYLFS